MAKVSTTAETSQHQVGLLSSLTTGLVLGFTDVAFVISIASLIFSGPLVIYLPRGIAVAFMSAIIFAVVAAIFSASKGMISIVQNNPGVLLAVAVSSITAHMAGSGLFATVITLILVTTLLTGGVFLLLGALRAGELVRFIPYPVFGGFLAGTGWLLVQGSIGTMAAYPLSLATLPALFRPDQLVLWLPGVILGVVLFTAMQRFNHIFVTPLILIGWTLLFFAALSLSGLSIPAAQAQGLLLGPVGGQAVWQPPLEFIHANWTALLGQAGSIGAIVLIVTMDFLLKIPALELLLHQDIDINRELRVEGLANLVSGFSGGIIGYLSISTSMLSHRMGARARPVLIIFVVVFFFMLVFGTSVLAYLPKALMGGLLLLQGLDFLYPWVVRGGKRLGRLDYVVVLVILITVATLGFMTGVIIGLILMIVLFVINYSRLNIFHSATSGAEMSSHSQRNTYHQRALSELGKHVHVMELQGYLFFGTANLIVERVRTRVESIGEASLTFLILDFRRVTGLDSSAAMSFNKVRDLAKTHQFVLVLTHVSEIFQRELARSDLTPGEQFRFFPDLDRGLEWCENSLLEQDRITKMHLPSTLQLQLADNGFQKADTEHLKQYLERIHFKPGEYLMRQGDSVDSLYFIETGQVSVYLGTHPDSAVRLQTLNMGTVVGELGIYLNLPQSASIVADEHTIAYRLTRQALDTMKLSDPSLVIIFHELIVRLVAERLVAAHREIAALQR